MTSAGEFSAPDNGVQEQPGTMAVFIPVRLGSTRLPGKALLNLAGKPALAHLIERLQLSALPSFVVVCTTTDLRDDPVEDLVLSLGARVFRGSRDDLLARFLGAAHAEHVDLIVNVDGDDILVDPEQVDAVGRVLLQGDADFVQCKGLPFGAAPLGLTTSALAQVCRTKSQTNTATGWGRFFTNAPDIRQAIVSVSDPELRHPELRMTLDYAEDYRFFTRIFERLYHGSPVRLRDAIRLAVAEPEIVAINSGLEQVYWEHFSASQKN